MCMAATMRKWHAIGRFRRGVSGAHFWHQFSCPFLGRLLRKALAVPENGYMKDACSGDLGGVAQARQGRLRYPSGGQCPRCPAPSRMRAKIQKEAPEHVPSSVPKDLKPDWPLWLVPRTGYMRPPIFRLRTEVSARGIPSNRRVTANLFFFEMFLPFVFKTAPKA